MRSPGTNIADGNRKVQSRSSAVRSVSRNTPPAGKFGVSMVERDGLVSRRAIPTVPVTVEYSITPLGRTLTTTVDALRVWAETHIEDVLAAQNR